MLFEPLKSWCCPSFLCLQAKNHREGRKTPWPATRRTPTHKCGRVCSLRRRWGRPSQRWGGGRYPIPSLQRRRRSPASPLPAARPPPAVLVPRLTLPDEALCRATSRRRRRPGLGRRRSALRTLLLSKRRTRPRGPSLLRCHSLALSVDLLSSYSRTTRISAVWLRTFSTTWSVGLLPSWDWFCNLALVVPDSCDNRSISYWYSRVVPLKNTRVKYWQWRNVRQCRGSVLLCFLSEGHQKQLAAFCTLVVLETWKSARLGDICSSS